MKLLYVIIISFTAIMLMHPLGNSVFAVSDTETDKLRPNGRLKVEKKDVDIPTAEDSNVVGKILNTVYSITGVLAVLMIVICGIMIITSDGDAQKVATARRGIIYALVGLLIVLSAFIITGVILNLAGSKI